MDILRGLAVIAMVVAHVARVVPAALPGSSSVRSTISLVEPGIAAAFLFLVGWSLSRSWQRASQSETSALGFFAWYRDSLKRAAFLYAIGVLLFLLQYGPQFPDGVLSPDILATIAFAVVVVGAVEPLRPAVCLLGASVVLLVAGSTELSGVSLSGINAGPGGTVPVIAIAYVGAWVGKVRPAPRGRATLLAALAAALAILVVSVWPGPSTSQHLSEYRAVSAATFHDTRVWFWNHTLKGIVLYGGSVLLAFSMLSAVFSGTLAPVVSRLTAPIALLGRHALIVYVAHLLVLGAIDRWGRPPTGEAGLFGLAGALLGAFLVVLMLVESGRGHSTQSSIRRRFGLRI